jgi:uncharacterized 2Fe-2S/4Fe-4S cluster protein (DUF4445 family)
MKWNNTLNNKNDNRKVVVHRKREKMRENATCDIYKYLPELPAVGGEVGGHVAAEVVHAAPHLSDRQYTQTHMHALARSELSD